MAKIGDWTIKELAYISKNNLKMYVVRHKCGYETITSMTMLERGKRCCKCDGKKQSKNHSKANICWDCEKYAKGCAWSERGEPVEGWTATKCDRLVHSVENGKHIYVRIPDGYHITACPLFERTPPRSIRVYKAIYKEEGEQ